VPCLLGYRGPQYHLSAGPAKVSGAGHPRICDGCPEGGLSLAHLGIRGHR
jgi:hypothetical protein